MNKAETKYYNTACLMDEALLLLLEHKDYDYITVKEVCQKAGVNRSTFYLHYEGMEDLLAESLSYMFSQFTDKYDSEAQVRPHTDALGELFLITPEYILPYLEFLMENKHIFMTAIRKPEIFGIERHFDRMYAEVFDPILERFFVDPQERKYIMKFYISGMHAIIVEWIRGGCTESTEFISDLIIKCVKPYKGGEDA